MPTALFWFGFISVDTAENKLLFSLDLYYRPKLKKKTEAFGINTLHI